MAEETDRVLVRVAGAGPLAAAISAALGEAGLIGAANHPHAEVGGELTILVDTEWEGARMSVAGGGMVLVVVDGGVPDDVVRALEAGAVDAVAGDVSIREVVLRSRAIVRRLQMGYRSAPSPSIEAGPIRLDPPSRRVWIRQRAVRLTKVEFDLLALLVANPGVVFDRAQLLERVWGYTTGSTATVTVHIQRLRSKIEDDPMNPSLITTVWGSGYLLVIPPPSSIAHPDP